MRHEWRDLGWTEKDHPLDPETRKCIHCGAIQKMERQFIWQRVVSRRWFPLVGKCKGKAKKRWRGSPMNMQRI